MEKLSKKFGPAMYFASDKNIFDALVQHKVDAPTLAVLFERRNVVVSKKTPRDDLAEYFSRLTHDFYDHKIISEKLGVPARRERITSMDLVGKISPDELKVALEQIKKEIAESGDIVHIARKEDNFFVNIQYSRFDYKKTEFSQLQVRDGVVEFIKTPDGYLVSNAQNDFMNGVRDSIVAKVDVIVPEPIEKISVSLFDVPDPKVRTKFFIDLSDGLDGFARRDVSDVFVYKPKPDSTLEDEIASDDDETHIEKVLLKGNGVTRSDLLLDLVGSDEYYIVKMCWVAKRVMGNGDFYKVEVAFADPKECVGFSVLVKSVYPNLNGKPGKRRTPLKGESDEVSRVIEKSARELMEKLR